MVSPVFHPFSSLPIELRLKIWQDACFPSSTHHRGIHYMGMHLDKRGSLGPTSFLSSAWASRPEKRDSTSQSNSSAYLWDAGLLRACKESRDVVIRHSYIKGRSKDQIFKNAFTYLCDKCRDQHFIIEDDPPRACTRDEDWHRIICPIQDIFCVSKTVWETSPRRLANMAMYFPFVVNKNDVRLLEAHNLALEYDPSWNLNWDFDGHNLRYLHDELSPRGFLAHMFFTLAASEGLGPILGLWLVDKGTKWVARAGQSLSTVYYDCDAEYVEVGWEDTRSDTRNPASPSAVTMFVKKLGVLCDPQYRKEFCHAPGPHPCGTCWRCRHSSVETSIKLLVRRDNEVKELKDGGECV